MGLCRKPDWQNLEKKFKCCTLKEKHLQHQQNVWHDGLWEMRRVWCQWGIVLQLAVCRWYDLIKGCNDECQVPQTDKAEGMEPHTQRSNMWGIGTALTTKLILRKLWSLISHTKVTRLFSALIFCQHKIYKSLSFHPIARNSRDGQCLFTHLEPSIRWSYTGFPPMNKATSMYGAQMPLCLPLTYQTWAGSD